MCIRKGSLLKFVGATAVAAVLVYCASYSLSQNFVEGVALPSVTVINRNINPGTSGWSNTRCAQYCVEQFGRAAVHEPVPPDVVATQGRGVNFCGYCIFPRDLSHMTQLGAANSPSQCGSMAGQARYLRYHYESRTGRCFAEGQYEYIGIRNTRKECIASTKEAGYRNLIWQANTQKCFGTQYDEYYY